MNTDNKNNETESKNEDICEDSAENEENLADNDLKHDMATKGDPAESGSVYDDSDLNGAVPLEGPGKESDPDDVSTIDLGVNTDDTDDADDADDDNPPAGTVDPEESPNKDFIGSVSRDLDDIKITAGKTFEEVKKIHKEYFNIFSGRLKTIQDELDKYHEIDQGRYFDDILSSLAKIYVNYETLDQEIEDPKVRKNVRYLLLDLLDLLESYNVKQIKSRAGEMRNLRHSKVIERIPTDNPEMDKTVAVSRSSGFCKGNKTIVEEKIDIYVCSGKSEGSENTEAEDE